MKVCKGDEKKSGATEKMLLTGNRSRT